MRFHSSVLTALSVSSVLTQTSADACGDVCVAVEGLCLDKGSWCDATSGNCKNLFMTLDSDLCFLTPQNPCRDAQPVKCEKALEDLETKRMFDRARQSFRNIPDDKKPRFQLKLGMPPPEEMAGYCVIC
jgi:hypothetical protein